MSKEPTFDSNVVTTNPMAHFLARGSHRGHRWTRVGSVIPGPQTSPTMAGRDLPREVLYCETDHKIVVYNPDASASPLNHGHTLGPHEAVVRGEAAAGIPGIELMHDGHQHTRVGTIAHGAFGTASVWYCPPFNNLMVDAKT